jgi:hypothetical protein
MSSYGQQLLACETVEKAFELEKNRQLNEKFTELDTLTSELAVRSLRGERIVTMTENEMRAGTVKIENLTSSQTLLIKETYDYACQQKRGNWSLPEREKIDVGWLNLTYNFADFSYFPLSAAGGETCKVEMKPSPEAVFLWSVLSPLIENLTYPIKLRSTLAGIYKLEELKAIWDELDKFYTALGMSDVEELQVFRFRGGWSKLENRVAQLEAKRKLLIALAAKITASTGTFYRLFAQNPLIKQYYKKAKSAGIVKRKQVITKRFLPLLTGFFGGDWLALVEYLDERPHPDEEIMTVLPKPQIYVGGAARAKEITRPQGVSAEEVEKIVASLWQEPSGVSPIEERTACLINYWQVFDTLHANQKPGMKSLWGLVEENGLIDYEGSNENLFHAGLYLELLPTDLIAEIERLWGTTMLYKYPEGIASEPFPHTAMAQAFGPALLFWQSCALTAWFLSEGPYSVTDMQGLAYHQRKNLSKLEQMGTPVDTVMFNELIEAEKMLGPEESIEEVVSEDLNLEFTVAMSLSIGTRRNGFEKLRDIITRHRQHWAEKYFKQYLKIQWESEINKAANIFFLKMNENGGKPLNVKQFASTATLATNQWFGGNISLLYMAIGERITFQPKCHLLMPKDEIGFVKKVAELLPFRDFNYYGQSAGDYVQKQYVQELARKALNYIQIYEATGSKPTLKEFSSRFKQNSAVLHDDEGKAWEIYETAIIKALQQSRQPHTKVAPRRLTKHEGSPVVIAQPKEFTNSVTTEKVHTINQPIEKTEISLTSSSSVENKTHQTLKPRSWLDRLLGRK